MQEEYVDLEKYISGYTDTTVEDGYIFFYRFGASQRDYYEQNGMWYGLMSRCQAGISLNVDNCRRIAFEFICKSDQKEVTFESLSGFGVVRRHAFSVDARRVEMAFDRETISLYFPFQAVIGIRNLVVEGEPVPKKKKLVFSFGDSITQGFSTDEPSQTYPVILGRALDAEVYNFGISGYFMRRGILNEIDRLPKPDIITFAYGTNDWHFQADYRQDMEEIFARLNGKYAEVPVFVLLPIARDCEMDTMRFGTLQDVRNDIRTEASKYRNFVVLESGKDMRMDLHFREDGTHPNNAGMRYLGSKVTEDILNVLCGGR